METLIKKVTDWGNSKGIIKRNYLDQSIKQLEKMEEEVNELREEIVINQAHSMHDVKLELGDVLVTAIMLSANLDTSLQECLQLAYDKIKARTGKTENGIFIKDNK